MFLICSPICFKQFDKKVQVHIKNIYMLTCVFVHKKIATNIFNAINYKVSSHFTVCFPNSS